MSNTLSAVVVQLCPKSGGGGGGGGGGANRGFLALMLECDSTCSGNWADIPGIAIAFDGLVGYVS